MTLTTNDDSASLDARYLEVFPAFLRTLGDDADALGALVGSADTPDDVRRYIAAGLNYIFKSLDLIPDGIDDLGFLDDAFVLRVSAAIAVAQGAQAEGVLGRLAGEAQAVKDFLGDVYPRLEAYVHKLPRGAARGRTVEDILSDASVRETFVHEIAAWAKEYEMPSFSRDAKTLIKLKAFLSAKLA